MKRVSTFIAYASTPEEVGRVIEAFANSSRTKHTFSDIETWANLEIAGRFIADGVLEKIDGKDYFVADITTLNFNVTFELGYAIGKKKNIWLIRNRSIDDTRFKADMHELGLFDTLGHVAYQNTEELVSISQNLQKATAQKFSSELNKSAPLYILDTEIKSDYTQAVISRVKKAGFFYRSFDPVETPRIAAYDVISNVAQSCGVIVSFLAKEHKNWSVHNQRAAFIAGLSYGMDKETLLLQFGDGPVPLDYRDFVKIIKHPIDIQAAIAEFAPILTKATQQEITISPEQSRSLLDKVRLGASAAENELQDLQNYYVETDAFKRTLAGQVRIVLGRKGSGKTALFSSVRNRKRAHIQNVVIDLKPETYKLLKFKDEVLALLEDGTLEHTIMAFWEYVLYLEICYKVLEKDKKRHVHDHELYEPYKKLADLYFTDEYKSDGDFSERVSMLLQRIKDSFLKFFSDNSSTRLSRSQITELIYTHQIRELRDALVHYLSLKESVCILIDNLDKGWSTFGVSKEDLIILRTLLDASRKIENHLNGQNIRCSSTIFLRNDVFELLLSAMSDRGKESKVLLDWTDREALTELVRRRLVNSTGEAPNTNFRDIWNRIADSHIKGEQSFEYLLDRCMMRPRVLIDLLNTCKARAVNRGSLKITEKDIENATRDHSFDLIREINFEIRDVYQKAEDVLYRFMAREELLSKDDLYEIFLESGLENERDWKKLLETLLWYGFIGLSKPSNERIFIYDVGYEMKILKARIEVTDTPLYCVNPAFWGALETLPTQ